MSQNSKQKDKKDENLKQNSSKEANDKTTEVLDITTLQEFLDLQKRLVVAEQQVKDSRVLAKSYLTDMERMRERAKKVEEEKTEQVTTEIAKKIIPILDNFEQAFGFVREDSQSQGFKMIFNQMKQLLLDFGIEEIAVEADFDPNVHDCVMTTPAKTESDKGKVAEVIKKGYKLNEKIIRHAVVRVFE